MNRLSNCFFFDESPNGVHDIYHMVKRKMRKKSIQLSGYEKLWEYMRCLKTFILAEEGAML